MLLLADIYLFIILRSIRHKSINSSIHQLIHIHPSIFATSLDVFESEYGLLQEEQEDKPVKFYLSTYWQTKHSAENMDCIMGGGLQTRSISINDLFPLRLTSFIVQVFVIRLLICFYWGRFSIIIDPFPHSLLFPFTFFVCHTCMQQGPYLQVILSLLAMYAQKI